MRIDEIKKNNELLVAKMLKIDVTPSRLNRDRMKRSQTPSSNSLNKAMRLKEIDKISHENLLILEKIQNARPHYLRNVYERQYQQSDKIKEMLCENTNKFERNNYFLHLNNTENLDKYYTFTPTLHGVSSSSFHRDTDRSSRPRTAPKMRRGPGTNRGYDSGTRNFQSPFMSLKENATNVEL